MKKLYFILILGLITLGITSCSTLDMETAGASTPPYSQKS